jgi:hypothetical protein
MAGVPINLSKTGATTVRDFRRAPQLHEIAELREMYGPGSGAR